MKTLYSIVFFLICYVSAVKACDTNPNSLNFSGSNTYVTIASTSNLQITDAITVEAWIYATQWQTAAGKGSIVCKHSWTGGPEQGFVLRAGGTGQLSFNFAGLDINGTPTSWKELISPGTLLTLNTWYHVAGSYDGDSIRLFINGAQVASSFFDGSILPNTVYDMTIGKLCDNGVGDKRYFFGKIDEVRIWNRPRPESEILADYNHHIDPLVQSGLVAYFRFNEGTGTTVTDLSGNNNNGTITGATWDPLVPFTQTAIVPIISRIGNTLNSTPAVSYQWNFGVSPLIGQTQPSYSPPNSGTFSVTITDANGCTARSAPFVYTFTGIDEISNELQLIIEQNSDAITIQNNGGKIIESLELFDANGRLIFTEKKSGNSFLSIPISDSSAGIYFLNIMASGKKYSGKYLIH
jgi:hypothetical protein